MLWVWRYAEPNYDWRGWQIAADPVGCRSVRNLLDRMSSGEPCYRTLKLDLVTEAVLSVPNSGFKCLEQFAKLRVEFQPEFTDLGLASNEAGLVLTVGNQRLRKLAAAFANVEAGGGDFGIATSDNKRADHWMFWWPP